MTHRSLPPCKKSVEHDTFKKGIQNEKFDGTKNYKTKFKISKSAPNKECDKSEQDKLPTKEEFRHQGGRLCNEFLRNNPANNQKLPSENVECQHMENKSPPFKTNGREKISVLQRWSNRISQSNDSNKPDKANIREALASPSESLRTKFRTYKDVLQHSFTHGSHYSDSSSETCKQISHKRVEPTDAHRHVHSCSVGVQDSLPNRRYLQVTKKGCNSPEPYKHCSTYGKQNKNYKDATFSPRLFCGNRRCVYPSDIHPSSQIETQSKNLSGKHSKGSEFSQKASGSGVFLTFDEARSRALPDETSGTEETNIGRSNEPRKPQERNHSTPILRKIGNDGTRLRNIMGDTFPLNSKKNLMSYWDTQQKDVAPRKKVIWTRTIRKSSMATPEQFNIPLHAPKVQPIDLSTAIQHMKPEVGTRFTDVWKNITMPHFPILNNIGILPRSNGSLSHTDIKQLSENGIIERVSYEELRSNPTKGKVLPSTVVEERNGVKRRRFICWPKHQNAILQNTYVSHVPIDQPGSYAESVRSPCAVKRDLKSSFWLCLYFVEYSTKRRRFVEYSAKRRRFVERFNEPIFYFFSLNFSGILPAKPTS